MIFRPPVRMDIYLGGGRISLGLKDLRFMIYDLRN